MAGTLVKDVIIPKLFAQYVMEAMLDKSLLIKSGIVQNTSEFNDLATKGGLQIEMPFWKNITGDPEPMMSNTRLNPTGITSAQDVARKLLWGKAWASEDLAAELAGDDPMRAIIAKTADYWNAADQKVLLAILKGVFGANALNNSSDLIVNIAATGATVTDANKFDPTTIIDAKQKLGDMGNQITSIFMHSAVKAHLQKKNLIQSIPASEGKYFDTYMGLKVLEDDGCPVEVDGSGNNKYTTYLFGDGAFGWGEAQNVKNSVEFDRDSLGGTDVMIHRRQYILHPRGVKFTGASIDQRADSAGTLQTPEGVAIKDLEKAANWQRVYEKKHIKIVKVVSN